MDGDIAQLMEMGASRAQAVAAVTKYKDVMQAAERFFDGEFENVKDEDAGPPVASSSKSKVVQRAPSPDPASDEDEEMAHEDDDDEGDYVDYDSDAELGTYHVADVDPYAGIFFSKDRRQEEIEIEEAPEYVSLPNTSDRIQLMSQGEWMKGCPEGSEQSFLFTLYHSLTDGTLSCMNCQQHIAPRKKSDFFALHPDFDDYTNHLKSIMEKQCPRCSKKSCFACGELYSDKHAGADVLHHCAELQGVIVGVGLYMVERMIAEQNGETSREDDSSESVPSKRRKTETPARKKAPGGTGYDGAVQEDNSGQLKALQDQRAKDESLGNLLTSVREYVPDMKRDGGERASDHMVHPTTLAHLRRRFCPALSTFLRNDSLTDMEERSVFYFELFEWLKTVANHESFASMMAQPVMLPISVSVTTKKGQSTREKRIVYEGSASPRELLESIVIQATAALKGLDNLSVQVVDEEMTEEEKRITGANAAAPVEEVQMSDENRRLFDFCRRIIDTAGVIDRFLRDTKGAKFFERMQSALPKITPVAYDEVKVNAGASDEDTQKAYIDWASRARFEYGDLTIHEAGGSDGVPHYKHYFSNEARLVVGSDLPRRSLSIAKELAVLTTNIPVSWGSSVFLRVDETRVDVIKAIITGPEGTPYHNGCYLFDIFLGTDYNRAPPRVKYMTTNGGAYRFNPNLYADGKVCLSLLGTWSGPGWVPGKSTLLQVLISIQAMILCEEPYLNEPGWAESAGTPQSKAYSANVRRMVVHTAMLDALRNPPEPFGDVIRTHFRLKAKSICAQLDEWLKMDDGTDTAGDGAMAAGVAGNQGLAGIALGRGKKAHAGNGAFAKHVQEMKDLLGKLVKGEPLN